MANHEYSNRMKLEQTQTQRLLPLQVRVGRLLEMNSIEVEEEVQRALEELPALEVADTPERSEEPEVQNEDFGESAEQMQLADYRTEDDIPDSQRSVRPGLKGYETPETVSSSSESSLFDTLMKELGEQEVSEPDMLIARYIIGNIDSNGYMSRDIASIADDIEIQTGLETDAANVRRVWQIVRRLDPPGIAATDLRDCLLLQLNRKPSSQAVEDAREIIANCFDLFSKKHFNRIASSTGMGHERLKEALAIIRRLDPKPGSQLGGGTLEEHSRMVVPDFAVETDGETLTLTLLNNIPELTIEKSFTDDSALSMANSPRQKKDVQTFIRQHRDEARDFIRIVKTRQETLFRVMSAIVGIQREFFMTEDKEKIRPMILKDIALLTGYDISVVSRATASKYVATQHGIYPLKMFFNERTQTDDDASQHRIMGAIRSIVDSEDKKKPFSDEVITSMLSARGFSLARRTVAKYREKLGIPVARLRKEI